MNVNNNLICQIIRNFHASFTQDNNWCEASGLTPNVDIYGKHVYQKVYALRYLPAYYFEYCILADLLKNRLNEQSIKSVNVISLGCGLSPDYYALSDNLGNIQFTYNGYDLYPWSQRILMPAVGVNFQFTHKSVGKISKDELSEYDVFIFPKSIGDINDSHEDMINAISEKIATTSKNRVYFLNSFISNNTYNKDHVKLFTLFHEKLIQNGFNTNDDHTKTFYMGSENQGLKGINYNFDYNNQYFIKCFDKQPDCQFCNVIKPPILTNRFMEYQILEYYR